MADDEFAVLEPGVLAFTAKKREYNASLFSRSPWVRRWLVVDVKAAEVRISHKRGGAAKETFPLRQAMLRLPPDDLAAFPYMIEVFPDHAAGAGDPPKPLLLAMGSLQAKLSLLPWLVVVASGTGMPSTGSTPALALASTGTSAIQRVQRPSVVAAQRYEVIESTFDGIEELLTNARSTLLLGSQPVGTVPSTPRKTPATAYKAAVDMPRPSTTAPSESTQVSRIDTADASPPSTCGFEVEAIAGDASAPLEPLPAPAPAPVALPAAPTVARVSHTSTDVVVASSDSSSSTSSNNNDGYMRFNRQSVVVAGGVGMAVATLASALVDVTDVAEGIANAVESVAGPAVDYVETVISDIVPMVENVLGGLLDVATQVRHAC